MLSRDVCICVGMVEMSAAIISDVPVYYPELMLVIAVSLLLVHHTFFKWRKRIAL